MKIILSTQRSALKDLKETFHVAVVLDILRATSTITTALKNGCVGVIPVAEVETARSLAQERKDVLLGGERNAVKLPGFHLGNSPLEYTPEKVGGKEVILTTTNGTGAIEQASKMAQILLLGSFLNARAIAEQLFSLGGPILLACAGTKGHYSLDDCLAAGVIIKELLHLKGIENYNGYHLSQNRQPINISYAHEQPLDNHSIDDVLMNDSAVAAYRLSSYYGQDIISGLYDCLHGQKLAQLGMKDDLIYCSQLNVCEIVPLYQDGIIKNYA